MREPLGRPLGLPDWPGSKRLRTGGLPKPTSYDMADGGGRACADPNRSSSSSSHRSALTDPAGNQLRLIFRISLPAPDDAIAVNRIEFAEIAPPAGFVGGDQGRPAAAEQVEDDGAPLGAIIWTGFTVGCSASSSTRPERSVLTPL